MLLIALVAAFYVGWNIGSNDAANAMGAPVGGRVITYRQAISIMVLFVLLGAVLEGWKVMETVGGDIVAGTGGMNPLIQIPELAVIALFAAGVWVTTATILKLPVSTSQSIVGAVMGAGLLLSFKGAFGASVNFGVLRNIGLAWVLSPIAAAGFAYFMYHAAGPALRRIGSAATLNRVLTVLVVSTGAFAAYSLGANDVGNATAMLYVVSQSGAGSIGWTQQVVGLFGGVALAVGALTYSRRVMKTVGTGITNLDAMTTFAAQFGAAFTVWIFTQFGVPVSTSQAIVGGVAGAGLVKGTAAVSKGKLGEIGVAWVLTPTVAAGLTFGLGWLVLGV